MEVALTALILFAILFFVYFRFAPKDGLTVVLTPLCFKLHIPYVMPVGSSLLRSAYSVIEWYAVRLSIISWTEFTGMQEH